MSVLQPGLVIAERYRLERKLGEGAMGAVWLGRHVSLENPVALKLIHAETAQNPQARARFEREAVIAAKIRSAHVVRVIDHGHHRELPFLVMEYLEGESLRDRLGSRTRLGLAATAHIVKHVCRALSAAHDVGLVHRDIKPENLFIVSADDGEEIVKVLDFGVAKVTDDLGAVTVAPTRTGTLIGTPYYVSPEQARGLKTVGPASDLWSLAVVAFECLTGQRPFTGAAMGPLIAKILQSTSAPRPSLFLSSLPPEIDEWFARALARDIAVRFPSAKEMWRAFSIAAGTADSQEMAPMALGAQPHEPIVADAIATVALEPEAASQLAATAILPEPATAAEPPPATPFERAPSRPEPAPSPPERARSSEPAPSPPEGAPSPPARRGRLGLVVGLAVAILAVAGAVAMWLSSTRVGSGAAPPAASGH
jgi:serine/threonine-protein kinase